MDKNASVSQTWGGRPQKTVKPKGLRRVWRAIRHSFTFHTPFPEADSKTRVRRFWAMVFLSLFLNGLVVLVLWLADKEGWVDRSAWDSWGWTRTQSMTDAGCEYAADDRTNYIAQPITALSNFTFTFVGFIVLQFAVLDIKANGWRLFPDPTTIHRSQLIGSNPLLR